jgi:hypothetical protein
MYRLMSPRTPAVSPPVSVRPVVAIFTTQVIHGLKLTEP